MSAPGGERRNGEIELDFGDGTYKFRAAGMGELEELQEKTGVGPNVLLQRLMTGEWRVADVRETIRIGLIGGGLEPTKALDLCRRYVDDRPNWQRNSALAMMIMASALTGSREEEAGKGDAPEAETKISESYQTDDLSSARSMQPPPLAE